MRGLSRRRVLRAIAAAAVCGFTFQAQGSTFNVSWIGGATGNYNTAANWSGGVVPDDGVPLATSFYNVTINRAGGATVTGNTSPTILNLTIGANAANQLTMSDTEQLELIGAFGGGSATFSNAGTLSLGSTSASAAALVLNGTATGPIGISTNITGGGTINMLGNCVVSGQGTVTSNNTIIGRGSLGNGSIDVFNNNGTVSASGGSLTVNTGDGAFKNNNLLQALSGGTLVLSGENVGSIQNGGAITNNDGTISVASGGRVQLLDNIAITTGTLTSALGATAFFIPGGNTATLNALTNDADVNVAATSTLNFAGTITNNGRIRMNAQIGVATFDIDGATVTLNGTGSLLLSPIAGANGRLIGSGTLVNGIAHGIFGAGTLGDNGSLTIRNNGTIDANVTGQTLNVGVEASDVAGCINSGTISASNGGILDFQGTLINTGLIRVSSGGSINLLTGTLNSNTGSIDVLSGTLSIATPGRVTASGIHQDGTISNLGTFTAGAIEGAGTILNGSVSVNAGSMDFISTRVRAVNVQGGAVKTLAGGGTIGTSRLGSLAIVGTIAIDLADSKWDLTDHDLVVDYTASSPLALIASYITSAFHNGAWDRFGLTSSSAQSSPSGTGKTALGYADASALGITSFSGQTIDSTTALVRYTYAGDANLDGLVNALDFNSLATNFGGVSGKLWNQGDFNYDGMTNTTDFNSLASNFNLVLPGPPLGSLVPEPAASAAAAIALIGTRHWRRGRRQFLSKHPPPDKS